MSTLKDKVAVVTGGAVGIVKETARVFLQEGAKVLLVDVDQKALENTIAEFNNPNAAHCTADVSNAAEVKKYAQRTLETFGEIDVFLQCRY